MSIVSANSNDSEEIAKIVAMSNKEVAEMFNINRQNNPKHPSFYDQAWVISDFERGEEYFLYREGNISVACVAYEQPNSHVGYLNRLSVLPAYRKNGIGEKLVTHILDYAKPKGIEEISIGIIAKHEKLKSGISNLDSLKMELRNFRIYLLMLCF